MAVRRKVVRLLVWLALGAVAAVCTWAVATNEYVWIIVSKGDNVPIAGMIPIVAFFTWLSLREAIRNDRRIREGKRDRILDDMRK